MYATAKSLQSCPTLCDPKDGSPQGSSVPRILQARTLECAYGQFMWMYGKKHHNIVKEVQLSSNENK